MTDLFPEAPIGLDAQIACVERELSMRRSVYARRVEQRAMTQRTADREIAVMEAVLATLRTALAQLSGQECGVYFLVHDERIVYVGQSTDVGTRVATHAKSGAKTFTHAAWIPCERTRLDEVERFWIAALRPTYNRAWMPQAEVLIAE